MADKKRVEKIRKKTITDNSSARKGSIIPKHMSHTNRQDANFFFGTRTRKLSPMDFMLEVEPSEMIYVGKPNYYDGHILIVGGAGSGKSSCIAIPTLDTWNGPIFAIDIKGELTTYWNGLSNRKREAKVFNLTNEQEVFSSYDPFQFLREDSEDNLVQNAREIAHAIIPLPVNTIDPFWIQSARHVLTAVILYGYMTEKSFNSTMTSILTTPIGALIEEIKKSGIMEAQIHINQFADIENPSDNKMLTGISAELSNKIIVFVSNMRIKDTLTSSENTVSWDDLDSYNVFMKIAEDKLGQWDGAIAMILTQLIRYLERRPEKYDFNGRTKEPVLLLLDEFPRLGKIDIIQNAVATLRSKNVTVCMVVQSLSQLDKIYGIETRQIIMDNCQYKAILNATGAENQKIFSDMTGSVQVVQRGISMDSDNENKTYIMQFNETSEPMVKPHEFATLKDIVLMTPEGYCRVDKLPYYAKARQKFS